MLRYNPYEFQSAARDFERARNRAMMKEIIARFTGQPTSLLSYDEVRKRLKAQGSADRGLQEIPLDAIVGSVGRYSDFTRDFLPRKDSIRDRWTRVRVAASGLVGLPPIEVYKLGEAYFVKDGNHRVSVAKEAGGTYIQAYVTEVQSRVPLTPDVKPDDLIIMQEQVDFLENTRLDVLRPGADLRVSIPGQYELLDEHISVHRYFMGIEQKRAIPAHEAVTHWYDRVYMPVIDEIRDRGILRGFPGRTETDMYLWIMEHRAALERELGWQVRTDSAINDLVQRYGQNVRRFWRRLVERMIALLSQGKLLPGPPPGQWRQDARLDTLEERLFKDILVPVDGGEGGWFALEQAMLVAQREGSRLHGLHIVSDESEIPDGLPLQEEFERRCGERGIPGQLAIVSGEVAPIICDRSRFVDLVVTNLAYPPGPQPFDRLESGFHDLIQRISRPMLATPLTTSSLTKALLAYDGSPKSEEALFIAAYLAEQWKIPLVVVVVIEKGISTSKLRYKAENYLDAHGLSATFMVKERPVIDAILQASQDHHCDLIIMGGYGSPPLVEVMMGSLVDQVLRRYDKPVLICR